MVDMIRATDGAEIGISDWDFGPNVAADAVQEVISEALRDDPPYICRPRIDGDPLAIKLLLPFASDDQNWVCWDSSFSHLIDEEMSPPTNDDERTNLKNLRDALQCHVERIDALLNQAERE